MSDSQRWNAVLGEQIRCAEAMLATLKREHDALASGAADALAQATDEKTKLVDMLERLEAERRSLGEHTESESAEMRQRLHELIARCKEQNERNGVLLKARSENVRIALQTLRGAEPGVYGASGKTPARTDARTLGTA